MKVTNGLAVVSLVSLFSMNALANIPTIAMVSNDVLIKTQHTTSTKAKAETVNKGAVAVSMSLEQRLQAQLDASLEKNFLEETVK